VSHAYTRPVVRSFQGRFVRDCAAWVRAGGHGVLWESADRARLVVGRFDKRDLEHLGRWAILDLGKSTYRVVKKGPLRGLVTTPVPSDTFEIVRGWAERDSRHAGPTRTMRLDCQACGACCLDNEVILERADFPRLRRGGVVPITRRKGGKVMLRVLANKKCVYLGRHNACGIYEARPNACRYFPPASECCLFAREEELDVTD
jgi:hypothetical protein